MTVFWCDRALCGQGEVAVRVRIESGPDGRITAIDRDVDPPLSPPANHLRGLALPGFANAHSHAFQRALRGRTQAPSGGSFWTWREQMYAVAKRLDPERSYALARATFAEMAQAGITLVGEFDYVHHSEAIVRAAADVGIRLTLIDACYLHGGLEQFHDADADAWAARVSAIDLGDPTRARGAAAIHSMRAVDPENAAAIAAFANDRGWPLHAHVSEQVRENDECLEWFGATPTTLLERAGALSERFTAVHATHLTEPDVALLREAETYCCMCPTTERDLADGIGQVPGRLTVGSDSQAVIDPFEEARAVELDLRLGTGVRGTHGAPALAQALTVSGYRSLGWPEGGTIAVGNLCDLVSVPFDSARLAGTGTSNALDAVLFAATAADVDCVVVGGEVIVSGGSHMRIDTRDELAAAISTLT